MNTSRLKKRTLSTRFIRFGLIFFTMLLTLGMIYFFSVSKKSLVEESKLNTINAVQRIVNEKNYLLTRFIDDSINYAKTIAEYVMLDDSFDLAEGNTILSKINSVSDQYLNFFDAEGNIATGDEATTYSIADNTYFKKVMKGETVVTDLSDYTINPGRTHLVSVMVPIKTSYGTVVGGVIYSYTIPALEQTLSSESLLSLGNLILFDNNNKIIFGMDFFKAEDNFFASTEQHFTNFDESMQTNMLSNINRLQNGYVEFRFNDEALVMVYETNELSGWTLVNILYESDLNDYTNAILQNYLRVFATGITIVILLYSFILLLSFKLISIVDHKRKTLEHEKEELSDKTMKDSMTNLLNKNSGTEIINSIISGSTPDHQHALFFIDIDNFKKINDTYGHDLGDQAILNLSEYLRRNFRSHDVITRFGGDEFVVFVQNFPDKKVVPILADRLCNLIEEANRGNRIKFTISIGISLYPSHATTYDELIACADKALYVSKNSGKNQYTIYNPSVNTDE